MKGEQRLSMARMAKRQMAESGVVDCSDLLQLTGEELAELGRRVPARALVAVRLDRDVLEWLRSYGSGYSTRMNAILRRVMEAR
jgi:uncharacterized protein (DUF4415 family)